MEHIWILVAFVGWGIAIYAIAYREGWKKGYVNAMTTPRLEDTGKKEGFKVNF
jgi:hypothetical protein